MPEPGPFGWVGNLARWASGDRRTGGQAGPLPPPRATLADPAEHDIYQGLADGWLHGTVGAALSSFMSEPRTRKELYVLYEKMDMTEMGSSVLSLYAEDATQQDPEHHRAIWFEGDNEAIIAECDALMERLHMEEEITALTRDVAKFGDDFERLVYRSGPDGGIQRMLLVPPLTVTRKEDKEGKLVGYQQTGKRFRNDNNETSYPWDFAHFRNRGKDRRYPYGTSILHPGIRPWKIAVMLQDWMLGYTVQKHPDRNLFLLDTGTSSDVEKSDIQNRFRQRLKRHVLMDPAGISGKNFGYNVNPMTPMEDLVLAVDRESKTDVKKISGSGNAADMVPLDRTLQWFYAAMRVPQTFLGMDGSVVTNPKASLTNQDIRYARAVRHLQKSVRGGLRYLCEFNLMLKMSPGDRVEQDLKKFDPTALDFREDGNDFKVHMSPISFLDELEKLDVMQTRMQVALILNELSAGNPAFEIMNWTKYILREIVKVPEKDLDDLLRTDIAPEELENLMLGARSDGTVPGKDGKGMKERIELLRRQRESMIREARPSQDILENLKHADGDLTNDQKKTLSEVLKRSPELRRTINAGRKIFSESDSDRVNITGLLPDRNNELFTKGHLADVLTEEDIDELLIEAKRDAGIRLGD